MRFRTLLMTVRLPSASWLIVVLMLGLSAPAWGLNEQPVGVTLNPGDTLYVRFALTDFTNFPDPFNTVSPNWDFSEQELNFTFQLDLYDDDDQVVGTFGPSVAPIGFGLGPQFVDVALGGGPASGGGRVPGDGSSYLDGTGMASLSWIAGTPVLITNFEALFGYSSGNSGSFPFMPFTITFAVNEFPAAIPEPASLAMLSLGALMMVRRRRA